MSNKSSKTKAKRLVGRIKWWADSNQIKPNKKSGFGVIIRPFLYDEIEQGGDLAEEIFAYKSRLECQQSDLYQGRWVSFLVRQSAKRKRKEAVDVKLIEEDVDTQTINDFFALEQVDEYLNNITVLRVCSKIPLEEDHPLFPLLIQKLPQMNNIEESEWPSNWITMPLDSPVFKLLPKALKRKRFKDEVDLDSLMQPVSNVVRDSEIYKMDAEQRKLALTWARNNSPYEKIKMLSARHAELKTAEFFSEVGMATQDIARHQLTGESDLWTTYDLLVDSEPVDVKNARTTRNGRTFVEYTIKQFKTDSSGKEVTIAGVLSPYLTEKTLKEETNSGYYLTILGTTTEKKIQALENEFSKRELSVNFGDETRWPIWVFNNYINWFSSQREALNSLNRFVEMLGEDDWTWCEQKLTPALIVSGKTVPVYLTDKLKPWQKWYLNKITEQAKSGGLTLPWLYLFTFSHFIEAITNTPSAEAQGYFPDGYNPLLFFSTVDIKTRLLKHQSRDGWKIKLDIPPDRKRPAGLIDPLLIIDQLIFTLTLLWLRRKSANLSSLRKFTFKGEGLLRAINADGTNVTVLAFCGGRIDGYMKCGNSPLIIGEHKTCPTCNMLVCDRCNHCSEFCSKMYPEEYIPSDT